MPGITIIVTVLNEGDNIHRLLDSFARQTRQADEIVITDGGSTDTTAATLQSYTGRLPLRVLVEPGCNISAGRNRAIQAASGEIIAVTDAGVVLADDWLEKLVAPLVEAQVAGGFFEAEPHTVFEAAMGATVLPLRDEIDPATFLPSSRSIAFRKSVWEQVGGYPEWLDYCEDLIFDLRLKQVAPHFAFAPGAVVYFRPRRNLAAFFRQYYLYARGDGKADLWRKRHAARYLTYLAALPAILALGLAIHPLLWLLLVPGVAVYLRQPYRRLPVVLKKAGCNGLTQRLRAAALVPIIRVTGDVAKMLGYPVGWGWRLRHHPPNWREVV